MDPHGAGSHERLKAVPEKPGVYLFRDASAQVLYVGKASSLRQRLRAYFSPHGPLDPKIRRMVQRAADFEFLVTHSESEALILENTLIKRHRPPYNTRLRDDKTYPYIKIDLKEEFPLVYITRRVANDGARYFGPFASAGSVRRALDLLKRLFPYRSCTKPITGHDPRPCLEYFIHRCAAPCTGLAGREEYQEIIQQVILFLEGRTEAVLRQLQDRMHEAAERLEFERAATLRDQVQAIQRVQEEQKVVTLRQEDLDAVALAQGRDEAWVEVFFIRRGKLIGRDHFIMEGTQGESPSRVLSEFVKQFYDRASFVPPLLLLQHPLQEAELIQTWLQQRRGGRVALRTPARGERRKLVRMVAENAAEGIKAARVKLLAEGDALEGAMRELQEALSLPRLPSRIECYDISNIRGTDAVGSMVVFEGGKARSAHYRRFKIRTVQGIDDYSMMQEVLKRRFRRLGASLGKATPPVAQAETPPEAAGPAAPHRDSEAWGIVPDLVLIDGGKGHLSAALQVFLELGIGTDAVPLAAIAKEQEELFVPSVPEPIMLPRTSQGLYLVQRVRDEAHRFAITYHQKLRSRRQTRSGLDLVPGIGPKRKRLLMRRFGTIKAIKAATIEDLAAIPGMTHTLAVKLKEQL
ncbi:MAG: excinuclease ABC subunit UvrC [Chloroflexi bacterium]|nr:excinuclease ABC subunit UvrC [Chloroflexota bacterium]